MSGAGATDEGKGLMGVHIGEEIPELPPDDEATRQRMQWRMDREIYRICKNYDRMTRATKFVVTIIISVVGAIATIAAFWEMLRAHFVNHLSR